MVILRPCIIINESPTLQCSRTHIVGECEIFKEERGVLEEMRKIDECDMDKFGTLLI